MKAKLEIKGEIAEDSLYEFVNAHSGLSIYELSKRLGWSTGKANFTVQGLPFSVVLVLKEPWINDHEHNT